MFCPTSFCQWLLAHAENSYVSLARRTTGPEGLRSSCMNDTSLYRSMLIDASLRRPRICLGCSTPRPDFSCSSAWASVRSLSALFDAPSPQPHCCSPTVPFDVAADVVMQDASPLLSSQSARVDNLPPSSTTPAQSIRVDNPLPPSTTPAQPTHLNKDATVRKVKVHPIVLWENKPTLIVVRSNAVSVWITEFKTWFLTVCVRYWFGSKTTGRQDRRGQTLGTHYWDLATY